MNNQFAEDVYDTLWGILIPEARIEGVENAFELGTACERDYRQMLEAYERICDRLGEVDEDLDVEIIIHSMLRICRQIGIQMYGYGEYFAEKNI